MRDDALPGAGDAFGPYRLLRELGRGGQAVVWLAEDPRLGRRVALKVLPALGPGSAAMLRRFQREAEVTSRLEHPAICPIYEADVQGGVPFLAMRFVEGETLAQRLARGAGAPLVLRGEPTGALAWPAIAAFFAKVARALHLAHEAGVVHRDIKPANLMVTPDGEPVILDFGLARQDDAASDGRSLTGDNSGTPLYMSPEQLHGRTRPDRRSDVYALGVVLFECATGRAAFAAATLEGLFQALLHEDVPDARRVNAAVPADLAVVVATATAKEPERRYKTALDLALDLERFLAHEPIAARPVTRRERLWRWCCRNPALAASLGGVVALVLVATGLLSYGVGASGRADAEAALRRRAVADQERAESEREHFVQAAADRALAARMDELNMKLGTLLFGFGQQPESLAFLRPAFEAVLRDAGVDLHAADVVTAGKQVFDALAARDADAGRTAHDLLRNFGLIPGLDAGPRQSLLALLSAYEDPRLAAWMAARQRWQQDGVDDFAPLLEADALATLSAEQLGEAAGMLSVVPGREAAARQLLDRALLAKPDSFALHYLCGGTGLAAAGKDLTGKDAALWTRRAVEHFQAAVALRPRSGLARACLASAQAVQALVLGDDSGFRTAWATLQTATEVEPSNEMVWFSRAMFLSRSPQGHAAAIAACKKALELEPALVPAQRLLEELDR